MGAEGADGPPAPPVDRRAETFVVVEAAHWKKEGDFTAAVEAYGRACYEFGVTGGIWSEKDKAKEAETIPHMAYTVRKEEMTLKGDFYLVFPENGPKTIENIVCLSPREKDAQRIASALQAWTER